MPPMLRGQDQLRDLRAQGPHGQLRTVAHQINGAVDMRKLLLQLLQGDGPVLADTGQAALFRQEDGVVDLLAPGVHAAADVSVHDAQAQGHRLQGGDAVDGLFCAPGEALGSGNADADTGEGTGTGGNRQMRHVGGRLAADLQKVLGHDHQGLAVGQAGILVALRQQTPAVMEGGRAAFCGGLKG